MQHHIACASYHHISATKFFFQSIVESLRRIPLIDEFEGSRSVFPVSKSFEKSAQYWQHILQSSTKDTPPQKIALRWERRWALHFLEKQDLKIDITTTFDKGLQLFQNAGCLWN
jgi:hypothetical protein